MAKSGSISLEFKGFDEMIKKLQQAEKDVKPIVNDLMQNAAKIQQKELVQAMTDANIDSGLIERMPAPRVVWDGDRCKASAGYLVGSYNPRDISDGYKVIFHNYGTPKYEGKFFIAKAKEIATPQIKKDTRKTLKAIVKELDK